MTTSQSVLEDGQGEKHFLTLFMRSALFRYQKWTKAYKKKTQ